MSAAELIDLRSDTVTRPTPAMRAAMAQAPVGDDVFGDDPTVNELECTIADQLGMAAALFVASGTQSNLLALLTHCQRGDEYIAGQDAHTYLYEAGGGAVLGSVQPQPLEFANDGTLPLQQVQELIKPDDFHFAKTRLVCLENTQNGKPLPLIYLQQYSEFCRTHGLQRHLDGARLFNAATALKVEPRSITQHFDSVSVCFSKGLGAPVGSALCGDLEFIAKARRWRKMLGGGMRQAGIIAAGALYALQHHVTRLPEDHERAFKLAAHLRQLTKARVEQHTNMVFLHLPDEQLSRLSQFVGERNILMSPRPRLVLHLDINDSALREVERAFSDFFA